MRRGLILLTIVAWLGVHLKIWTELPQLPRHVLPADGYSSFVGFTGDGTSLVTRNTTHVRVWDVASGTLKKEWPVPDPKSKFGYLMPHDQTVVVEDWTHDILTLLNLNSGEWTELPPVGRAMYGQDAGKLFWHRDDAVGFSPDGRTFAYAAGIPKSNSFVIRLWDVAKRTASEIPLERRGFSPTYSPDGKQLAVWIDGQNQAPPYVALMDVATRAEVARLETPAARLIRPLYSPDGQTLAVCGVQPSRWCQLWDLSSHALISTNPVPGPPIGQPTGSSSPPG